MKITAKTPEGRLRQFCVLRCREYGKDEAWMYAVASDLVGRQLTKGWGLSTCTKPELIRIADQIKLLTGGTPGEHRPGPRGARRVHADPTGVVTYLASIEQRDLILALAREVFGGAETHSFRAFVAKMTFKSDVRLLSGNEARKVIDALTAMAGRGWRPRASDRTDPADQTSRPAGEAS
jgi:hypothetical protein